MPWRDGARPAAVAAAMLGSATALVVAGLTAKLQGTFDEIPEWASPVVGASLLAVAGGVRLPHGLAVSLCAAAWRRFVNRGTASQLSSALIRPNLPDRALYWLAMGVIALLAGASTALLPLTVSIAEAFYEWMYAHFLWSTIPLAVLQIVTVFAAGVLPLAALGLSISCVHHLGCRFAQWNPDSTAWVLCGAALGTFLASRIAASSGNGDLLLIAGSLPALLVSIGAAFLGSSGGNSAATSVEPAPAALPLWSDRWPTLLRASIVVVGGGSACATFVWLERVPLDGTPVGTAPALVLVALAIGLLCGARRQRLGLRSIGGFGAACNVAGVVVALGALAFHSPRATGASSLVLACAGVAAVGFATAYGRQALLLRVASRSSAGAIELGRLLVCTGLTLLVAAPLAVAVFGPTAALMMLALSLVALGGTLIIHDPVGAPHTRRVRIGGLFFSVATMVLLCLVAFNGR